jgi:hypothetical protein
MFLDTTPRSPLKVNRRFGEMYRLHHQHEAHVAACYMLLFCTAHPTVLKMGATNSSEISTYFQQTIRYCVREDSRCRLRTPYPTYVLFIDKPTSQNLYSCGIRIAISAPTRASLPRSVPYPETGLIQSAPSHTVSLKSIASFRQHPSGNVVCSFYDPPEN